MGWPGQAVNAVLTTPTETKFNPFPGEYRCPGRKELLIMPKKTSSLTDLVRGSVLPRLSLPATDSL